MLNTFETCIGILGTNVLLVLINIVIILIGYLISAVFAIGTNLLLNKKMLRYPQKSSTRYIMIFTGVLADILFALCIVSILTVIFLSLYQNYWYLYLIACMIAGVIAAILGHIITQKSDQTLQDEEFEDNRSERIMKDAEKIIYDAEKKKQKEKS